MSGAKSDARVAKKFNEINQLGIKARDLAKQYDAQLSSRLDAGIVADLIADLAALGESVPAVHGAKEESVTATREQASALEVGYQMVTAVRTNVARKKPGKNVTVAYGVGTKTSKLVVKDVKGALNRIIKRAQNKPQEAARLGILPADIASFTAQLAAIEEADQAQEDARAQAPQATKQRNATARRILGAVDNIAGAGIMAFATSATERALFEGLIKKAS